MAMEQKLLFTGSDDMSIIIWNMEKDNRYMVGKLTGHTDSISDLLILQETGVLLSCSQDKSVIAWKYEQNNIIEKFERNEELRCMDYINSSSTLFVGTGEKKILNINIERLLDPRINLIKFQNEEETDLYN